MEFFRQEYWSGLPFPSPGDLPGPGIEPVPLTSPALAGVFFVVIVVFTNNTTWEARIPNDYTFFYPGLSELTVFQGDFQSI